MEALNIVELITSNPITKLSGTYQSKLLTKIKESFSDTEQNLFVSSFYCYLNYNKRTDFVIDLDNVWKWLGFNQKYNAKYMLEKNFIVDINYKIITPECSGVKKETRGGHNKETIMLNIDTFKKYCMKAGTKKSNEIHDYYIKLEEILQDILEEESDELKLQLEEKDKKIENQEKEKEKIREKTILDQFENNTQCVYYGIIDNVSEKNEKLIKFGNSNNLRNRIITHKETYSNFRLVNAFKVDNKLQIENAIKDNVFINERQRNIFIKNKKYIELLSIDGITYNDLDKIIKDIIIGIEYSPENYKKILDENKLLRKQLNEDVFNNIILLKTENNKLRNDNIKLIKKYKKFRLKTEDMDESQSDLKNDTSDLNDDNVLVTKKEQDNYDKEMHNLKDNLKNCKKNKDGKYCIDGKIYDSLCGSRDNVYYEKSYKTSGGLIKEDLILNQNGLIVSKLKSISETIYKRFEKCGVNTLNT
jgi:phage anti-repressor protein